ncbi:two-component sensor histidine kinase [Virgisporangium aliadipatigenens]|uniref:histidine kinase n=1 Tax=Virgisporangium aliadipatigenens TaxID=741659 RepID=A0A8J3YT07_9ACTN|nr:sensor histidine kinase [Virgisporangium aliadipatigenens]GIJ50971.1 two-component sensor histidine kinase [Virgisporangium aliadipatigenens]
MGAERQDAQPVAAAHRATVAERVWGRLTRVVAEHRAAFWVAVAVFVCAAALFPLPVGSKFLPTAVTAVVVAGSFVVVPLLRWPSWMVPATATAGVIALMPIRPADSPIRAAIILAVLFFAVHNEPTRVAWVTAAAGGAIALAGIVMAAVHDRLELGNLEVLPWVLAAAATGQALRSNRAQRAMLEERARRAEQGREDEARSRVQAERLRIARDLHDAVGHHVALINVQAGALTFLLDRDPAKARQSVEYIQNAGEAALEELRLTVGLLRQPGDLEPLEPAGRLGQLDQLIDAFTATGLHVTCDVIGDVRPLPEAVDLTAYRLIQESLTNTTKHAAATSASVRLTFHPGTLLLAVEDDGRPASDLPTAPAGHGIIGMRERAAALGGHLSAGPRPEGGFRVSAELPTLAGVR